MANQTFTREARVNPHKTYAYSTTRERLQSGTGDPLVSRPQKSDTPEAVLQTANTVADLSAVTPDAVTKESRTGQWRHASTIISARSKRELRQLVKNASATVISNIQINDQGKYFVYTN